MDGIVVVILDPADDGDCSTGSGSANPHVCVCDNGTWRPDYPDNHELIVVNDSATAPAIVVDASNRVGIRTATPGDNLHVFNSSDSSVFVRIESTVANSGAGVSMINDARRYDLGIGTTDNFTIFDSTAATFPLTVEAASPTASIHVASDGDIGMGTATPATELHVAALDGTDGVAEALLTLENNGAVFFRMENTFDNGGQNWFFAATTGDKFQINSETTGGAEFQLNNTGDLQLAGDADVGGHLIGSSSAPAVSACGTSPSISGTDLSGKVTAGSGTPTSCTVTFATAYTSAPACVIVGDTSAAPFNATTSTTVLTITNTAAFGGEVIMYVCVE